MFSIRRNNSSNPMPLSSGSGFPLSKLGSGGRLDRFPDLVAVDLATVGKPLAFDTAQDSSRALNVVKAELDPMVPAEIEFTGIAL